MRIPYNEKRPWVLNFILYKTTKLGANIFSTMSQTIELQMVLI